MRDHLYKQILEMDHMMLPQRIHEDRTYNHRLKMAEKKTRNIDEESQWTHTRLT